MNKVNLYDASDVKSYDEIAEWLQKRLNQDCPLIEWRVPKADKNHDFDWDVFTIYGQITINGISLDILSHLGLREFKMERSQALERIMYDASHTLARAILKWEPDAQ